MKSRKVLGVLGVLGDFHFLLFKGNKYNKKLMMLYKINNIVVYRTPRTA